MSALRPLRRFRDKKDNYLYVLHSILHPGLDKFIHYDSYVQNDALPSVEKIRRPRV